MNESMLRKFINGDLDEAEFRRTELVFESSETVAHIDSTTEGDSIVDSIKSMASLAAYESSDSHRFTERMESLVARHILSAEELRRVLDEPTMLGDLGRIGRYRVEELLAAGGMGIVFRGYDTELSRAVCIKVLHPGLAMKPDARIRFERESRAAAKLRSERIVTLLDIGIQKNDLPYIVMQLLDGESLRTKLNRVHKLDVETAIRYSRQIAEGLSHANQFGILHRDIKPDNIWITPEDDIKLLDFGLARTFDQSIDLTTSSGIIGTPQYMSPEQIGGEPLDARSDFFSVGIVLYELLTGTKPFQKNSLFATMLAISNEPPDFRLLESDPDIPKSVQCFVQRLLNKNRDERPNSADELIVQLDSLFVSDRVSSRSIGLGERTIGMTAVNSRRGNGWRVLLGMAAGMAFVLFGFFAIESTNKGTLVVRTTDPNVDIRIKDQTVSIVDPITTRKYEIRIGKTVLPSGVYQLEMTDGVNDLTFSSNVITIRRGKETIVEVELQPAVANSNITSNPDSGSNTVGPDGTTLDSTKSADTSHDPIARGRFAEKLESLPAIHFELQNRTTTDSATLTNSKKEFPGIDDWKIEPTAVAIRKTANGVRRNCDASLMAYYDRDCVRICDRFGIVKYLLPARSNAGNVKFDNRYPNLLATISYDLKSNKSREEVKIEREIQIWRLNAEYAEMLFRFPTNAYDLAWDQGYRLIYKDKDRLMAFRLDENKSYELVVPGSASFYNSSLSPDGRFLSTINSSQFDFWDLRKGEFAMAVSNGTSVSWSADSKQVAVKVRNKGIEIWNSELRKLDSTIDIQSESKFDERERTREGTRETETAEMEPSFQRIAWLNAKGELIVRHLKTNRQNAMRITQVPIDHLNSASILWAPNGCVSINVPASVQSEAYCVQWMPTESEVHGKFNKSEPTVAQLPHENEYNFSQAYGTFGPAPLLSWVNESSVLRNSDRSRTPRSGNAELVPELIFRPFDLEATEFVRNVPPLESYQLLRDPRGVVQNAKMSGIRLASVDAAGQWALVEPVGERNSRSNPSSVKYQLRSLIDSDVKKRMEGGSFENSDTIQWTRDGKYIAFVRKTSFIRKTSGQSNSPKPSILYDIEKNNPIPFSSLGVLDRRILAFIPFENHFLAVVKDDKSEQLRAWWLNPSTSESQEWEQLTAILEPFNWVGSLAPTDNHLVIRAQPRNALGTNSSDTLVCVLRVPFDANSISVQQIIVPQFDDMSFSSNGEFVFTYVRTRKFDEVQQRLNDKSVPIATEESIKIWKWSDEAKSFPDQHAFLDAMKSERRIENVTTSVSNELVSQQLNGQPGAQWHPNANSVCWHNSGSTYVYDADKDRVRILSHVFGFRNVMPTKYGWLCVEGTQMRHFDFAGNELGRIVFEPKLENGMPASPQWIMSDGCIGSRSPREGLTISYTSNDRLTTESLDRFEASHPDIRIPTFETVPFLQNK